MNAGPTEAGARGSKSFLLPRYAYRVLSLLLTPIILLRDLRKNSVRGFTAGYLSQRLGFVPRKSQPVKHVWLHAVSLGESRLAVSLYRRLKQQREVADIPFWLTATTATGMMHLRSELKEEIDSGEVVLTWAPLDGRRTIARFVERVRPSAMLTVETEIFPLWTEHLKRIGCPWMVVNARLSLKSARGYLRWGGDYTRHIMNSCALFAAQSSSDARLFRLCGADERAVQVLGSAKFDGHEPLERREPEWDLLAISTHPEDDPWLLALLGELVEIDGAPIRVAIAPRHVERAQELQAMLERAGHAVSLHTQVEQRDGAQGSNVHVIDSYGVLPEYFATAKLAFMGGSVANGAHNVIEPVAAGCPTIIGPSYHAFAWIVEEFLRSGGIRAVSSQADCIQAVAELLADARARDDLRQRGYKVCARHTGALDRQVSALIPWLTR